MNKKSPIYYLKVRQFDLISTLKLNTKRCIMSKCKKSDDKNLPKRSRYYQGMIDLDLIQKGKNYNELKKSFVIFICTFDPFKKGRHLYTFENRCLEDLTLHLNDATTKIFLNTKGSLNDVNQEMIEFLTYIENSTDDYANEIQNELVKTIHNKVKYIKTDKSMEVGTHHLSKINVSSTDGVT